MASELFNKGLVVRKEVLGEAYVEKSIKGADEFALAMQEFATEAAWGSIWTRPGLPRKTRSLLNIAMLTIMNRQHGLKLHIRSSFTNGVTKDEIKEVLLQVAAAAANHIGQNIRTAANACRRIFEVRSGMVLFCRGDRALITATGAIW